MVARVAWIEPVLCESEHEAAFLEIDLLARHPTRYNRTLGMESQVWLRLSADTRRPGLEVVHEPTPGDGAAWFVPYLGWEPTRQAAAGLLWLFPLGFTATALKRSDRELGRCLGVAEADREGFAGSIRRVLERDAAAVSAALARLVQAQDGAADRLAFEHAASVRERIRGLRWVTEPQKLASLDPVDGDHAGRSGQARVVLSLRGGRLAQRHFTIGAADGAHEADADGPWTELARRNAELLSRLWAAGVVGPLGWRH